MAIRLITAPPVTPVTLAETKAHLNVDFDDDDALIQLYITAATDDAQEFMGRAIVEQTWELVIDAFPAEGIRIPKPPLISVTSIKYDDADGVEQLMPAIDYAVDSVSEHGWVVPLAAGWPATIDAINAVRIRYVAGYTSTGSPADYVANIPFAIKAAILMEVGSLYAYRETQVVGQAATKMPWSSEQLLRQYRIHIAMA